VGQDLVEKPAFAAFESADGVDGQAGNGRELFLGMTRGLAKPFEMLTE
jgi:hypothetical protein